MRIAVGLLLVCALLVPGAALAAPEGQMTWAVHVTIAPTWFDPIHDRVMFAPIIEPAFLNGVGSRVAAHGLGTVPNFPYASPYEDLKLK